MVKPIHIQRLISRPTTPYGHCMSSFSLSKLEQLRLHQRGQWSLRFCWIPYLFAPNGTVVGSYTRSNWSGAERSGVASDAMGRKGAFFLYVVRQTHEVQESPSIFITFVAWSLSEVIRYPHYAFNCMGICPSWITYLRYTAFVVLYPPGMAVETWLMYQALPFIKKKSLSPHFSAGLSFSYYNFLRVLLVCYLFLLIILTVGSR